MRIADHPIHPALVHFPIAFWSLATLLDGLNLIDMVHASTEAWYCLILGSVMAVPAMATGWFEYTKLDERIVKLGSRHMILMGVVWVLYLAALFARTRHRELIEEPGCTTYVFSIIAFFTMMIGGWIGGQLVYRHGAGAMSNSG
jgi:uncharacterized membrane protein